MTQAIRASGMSVEQYNQLTTVVQPDPELSQRLQRPIDKELITKGRLQKRVWHVRPGVTGRIAASLVVTYLEHMIRTIRHYLIIAGIASVSVAVSQAANAAESYESGETLLSLCGKPQDSSLYGFCAGYIIGAADVLDEETFCPPEGHEKLQIVDVTVQCPLKRPPRP